MTPTTNWVEVLFIGLLGAVVAAVAVAVGIIKTADSWPQ